MNNEGSKRFNNDGSRNAYVYGSSPVIYDETPIQNELNIPLFIIVNVIFFAILVYGLLKLGVPRHVDNSVAIGVLAVSYFYFMCFELLIRKTGNPWWGALIPFYNIYLFLKLAFVKPISGIIPFIIFYAGLAFIIWYLPKTPYADYISYVRYFYYASYSLFPLIYMYKLGTNFNRSGLLMILLGIVLIPTTAFSSMYDYNGGKNFF